MTDRSNFYKQAEEIDNILASEVDNAAIRKAIDIMQDNKSLENYFFSKVSALKWFDELNRHGYFNAEKNPDPLPAKQRGYYSIPEWNILLYLEKVSERLNLRDNEEYIDKLLRIIKDVSAAKKDNYRTWWFFAKILINIPPQKIPDEVIELIPIWLDSKFDVSLVGSEVGLKLLPHFLSGDPPAQAISKAEMIVSCVADFTQIKQDKKKTRLINIRDKFKFKIDPYYVKDVFEKYSKDIAEKCTSNVLDDLITKIKKLLNKDESLIPIETETNAYLLVLSSNDNQLSVEIINVGEKADFNVYEEIFRKKKREGSPVRTLSYANTTFDDFKSKVFEFLIQDEPFKSSDERKLMRDIHNLYCNFYDSETHTSLHDESRTHVSEPREVLTFALKSILMFRSKKHIDETKDLLKRFFEDNYLYFPKMALYVITNNINTYSDIFWDSLEKDKSNLIFGEIYFGDELKHVFESLSDLSTTQKELIFKKLDDGPGYIPEEDAERHIDEWKQERCQALIKYPEFNELYESLKSKTGVDVGLHSAVGEIKIREGGGPSPLNKEDILKKLTANELPTFLKEFKSKSFWEEGPTVSGLAQLLKECVAENANMFIDNLFSFNDVGFIYIYEILDGSREAWNKKQDVSWEKLFEFIQKYIDKYREDFWKDKLIVEKDDWRGGANHLWIIGAITELIRDGTRDDYWAFDEKYLREAEQILFLILDKLEVEEEGEKSDYVTHALNSPHGKTLSALINLALRIARINDKKGDKADIKWSAEIKGQYNDLMENKVIESYTLLGRYLANLFYLDKGWVGEQIKRLYPDTANQYWEAFIDGYLSIGTVYSGLYELMTPHYDYGISYKFKKNRNNEHLAQHITLGYILGYDPRGLDESETLIRKELDTWKPEQILDIVSFLWSQQRYLKEDQEGDREVVKKIITLWKWIYDNKYKDKSKDDMTDNDKKIQSSLSQLTVFLPSITEEYSEWLLYAAPYAEENRNVSFFIEFLDKYDDPDSIKYVGQIYLKMLASSTPSFNKEHIRSIVEKLYKHDCKDQADEICNTYGMRGMDFLRDLYEENNP